MNYIELWNASIKANRLAWMASHQNIMENFGTWWAHSCFIHSIKSVTFHRDQKTALITLLLKKGKDPLSALVLDQYPYLQVILRYMPKYLLCVIQKNIYKVIQSLINEDQTGFIKGCYASDNMRRLLHIIVVAETHPYPCAVFSLDAEKAFR